MSEQELFFSIPLNLKNVTQMNSFALNIIIVDKPTGENSTKQVDLILYDSELQAFSNQTFFEIKMTNNVTVTYLFSQSWVI